MLLLFTLPLLMASTCKKNPLGSPSTPTVKLLTTINYSTETIYLGDTLKFTLVIPDTLNAISKIDGTTSKVFINSLQSCNYNFTFYNVDTITKIGTRIRDAAHIFVTSGSIDSYLGSVFTSNNNKPFSSVLNIIPPTKGLYYIEFGRQETLISANLTFNAGLRVNMSVLNKHWNLLEALIPGISSSLSQYDIDGYGYYCFKVD